MEDRDREDRVRSRGDLLLTTLSLAIPVAIYNLLLLERKYSYQLWPRLEMRIPG